MASTKPKKPQRPQLVGKGRVDSGQCRVCGDHRRAKSGWHLSKREIDGEMYIAEFHNRVRT